MSGLLRNLFTAIRTVLSGGLVPIGCRSLGDGKIISAAKAGRLILCKGAMLCNFSIATSCVTKFDVMIFLLQSHFRQIMHTSNYNNALALGVISCFAENTRGKCILKNVSETERSPCEAEKQSTSHTVLIDD